ncbi:Pumilio 8 like [Actinidia chinensis var. chinensis]|uniref:Pumilio 8 like n=1 Tax=Actinidia chinensis var. chinensis TaxID=1590841 RepID=A0A2R6QM09_ACTCC|nr:Pumilio 8 like [Actinidia chinensis var. chinensis]
MGSSNFRIGSNSMATVYSLDDEADNLLSFGSLNLNDIDSSHSSYFSWPSNGDRDRPQSSSTQSTLQEHVSPLHSLRCGGDHGVLNNLYSGMEDYGLNYNPVPYYMNQSPSSRSNEFNLGNLYGSPHRFKHWKYLLDLLENANPATAASVLKEVFESLFSLMIDPFHRYLFESLVKKCDYNNLELIVWKLTLQESPSLADVAFTKYGSQSIQFLIHRIKNTKLAIHVTQALSYKFFPLMTHTTGRYVLKHCWVFLDSSQNKILYEAAIKQCIELASNPVGCISLQDCMDYMSETQQLYRLLSLITDESVRLSFDTSGNYVVQYILRRGDLALNSKICRLLRGKYEKLSLLQHGSHVVEKCLAFSPRGMLYLFEEISEKEGMLVKLARNQFGNYVVQTALKKSKQIGRNIHKFLVANLEPHLSELQQTRYGRIVANLIGEQTFQEVT